MSSALSLFFTLQPAESPSETVKHGAFVSFLSFLPARRGSKHCAQAPHSSRAALGSWTLVPSHLIMLPNPAVLTVGKYPVGAWALPCLYKIGPGSARSLSGCTMSRRPHGHCLSGKVTTTSMRTLVSWGFSPGCTGALIWAPQWGRCQHSKSVFFSPLGAAASNTQC